MWIWEALVSAVLLGIYDVAKKQAMKKNSAMTVLLLATAMSTLLMSPMLSHGSIRDHSLLMLKAVLVTTSWISGMYGIKCLPLTIVSTIKGTRPVIVVLLSLVLFGEVLNFWQWGGVVLVFAAIILLGKSSRKEGIGFRNNAGLACMIVSVLSGAASAIFDRYILRELSPTFTQSWSNLYITAILALIVAASCLRTGKKPDFRWDWTLVLIAVFITAADFLYFKAVSAPDSLLSVISMVRRCSIAVTFVLGAWLFKEHNLKEKSLEMAMILGGMSLLVFGS